MVTRMTETHPAAVPAPTVPDDATQARANLMKLARLHSALAIEILDACGFGHYTVDMIRAAQERAREETRAASTSFAAAMLLTTDAQTPAEEPWVVVDTRANFPGNDGLPFLAWTKADQSWGWDDNVEGAYRMTRIDAEVEAKKRPHVEGLVAVPLSRAADVARGSR